MTGEATWLTAAILLFGAIGILLLRYAALRPFKYRYTRPARIACPVSKEPVDCTFVGSTFTGEVTGIERCSAFADPDHVTCGKTCVPMMNSGEVMRLSPAVAGSPGATVAARS